MPPRVGEVLVKDGPPDEARGGHDPASTLAEQCGTDIAALLMVDVTADRKRKVDDLRLQSKDFAAQQVVWGLVVVTNSAKQLVVALVPAIYGVRKVQKNDGAFREPCVALLFDLADLHRIGRCEVDLLERTLAADRVRDRSRLRLDIGDVCGARPCRALPELPRLCDGALLGQLDAVRVRHPRRARGGIGRDPYSAAMFARLKASVAGQLALLPKPSAARWYSERWPLAPPVPE